MGRSSSDHKNKSRSRLLIVDDDELMLTYYKSLFRRFEDEFICRFEQSGKGALVYLKTNQVDAVISDWDMPAMSGLSLVKAIRSDTAIKDLCVLIISGRTSVEDQITALQSGANEFLFKPVDPLLLLTRLRSLLGR